MSTEKLSQKEIWNSIASEWNKYRQKPLEEALIFLKNKKGKILDLGCGSGRHLIKKSCLKFYEVDFSKEMIEFAKKNAKKKGVDAEFYVSSAEKLPFEDNFFDSAIYIATLHCIETESGRKKSIKELYRVLKSGAEAIITVWSKNHIKMINRKKESTVSWKKGSEKLQRYYYLYDKEELEELLRKNSFKIVKSKEDEKNIIVIVKK
ncbi:MAG: class I SAM-dependent methyltransferase [Candidatus Pacearchaeota archaeon]|nr:class I SAM-dependent methyltransferase [Candidatus Pacearchaeota archaeon]